MTYRVREAVIEVREGCRERRFIAEREVRFFGIRLFWFPMFESGWRTTQARAEDDIAYHKFLSTPVGKPKLVE